MSEHVKAITTATFDQEVLQSDKPVLVDFWAEWCGPCRTLAPIFEEVAQTYQAQVTFGKVNIDEDGSIASRYGVMTIPTLILFKNGEVAASKIGLLSKSQLSAFLGEHI